MTPTEIKAIIRKVLNTTESVVAQLKVEKKSTGDYSKSVTMQDGELQMLFNALEYCGKYPPISVNLLFFVIVFRDDIPLMKCRVANIKHQGDFHFDFFYGHYNCSDKYKMCALVCDHSQVKPLFHSGDTLCIDNNPRGLERLSGKAAFAKVEILSEMLEEILTSDIVECHRRIRLTKELGHNETLAYVNWDKIETYVPDNSTQEYFGDKETLEMDLSTYYKTEEREADGCYWLEFTEEAMYNGSKLQLTTPTTETEIIKKLKHKALDKLLENCRAEFCYGDPRVEKYKEEYMILGEETIDKIYKEYLTWLKENCTTFAQDASSGEFNGIAIDWQGKEDEQPLFNI